MVKIIFLLLVSPFLHASLDPEITVTCEVRHFHRTDQGVVSDLSDIIRLQRIAVRDDALQLVANLWTDIGHISFFMHSNFSDIADAPADSMGRIHFQLQDKVESTEVDFRTVFLYQGAQNSGVVATFKIKEFLHKGMKVNNILARCDAQLSQVF